MNFPERYLNLDVARARFGARVDWLGRFLFERDELADRAIEALAPLPDRQALIERALSGVRVDVPGLDDFIAAVSTPPDWADFNVIDRGGQLLFRAGMMGGIVLGAKALVYGYAAPGGNKPLVFSGRLTERAGQRLNETARFVEAVCHRGGMHRYGEGFRITLKVRLMHAQVRRMIEQSGKWDAEKWGAPINQHDMVATALLFSLVTMDGLRQFGMQFDDAESQRYMHLWRYVGWLMGVRDELLPRTEAEAIALGELIAATQGPPDDDSVALVRALLESGEQSPSEKVRARAVRTRGLGYGFCRALVGDALADQLQIPRTNFSHILTVVRPLVEQLERSRVVPFATAARVAAGQRYWQMVVREGVYGATSEFVLPERLSGRIAAQVAAFAE